MIARCCHLPLVAYGRVGLPGYGAGPTHPASPRRRPFPTDVSRHGCSTASPRDDSPQATLQPWTDERGVTGERGGGFGLIRREVARCRVELDRLRQCAPFALSVGGATAVSAVIALLGNGIVLLGHRWNAAGWTTLVGVPLLGAAGSLLLRLRGWRWGELGWRRPTVAAPRAVPWSLLGAAPVAAAMSAVVWTEWTGDVTVLDVIRLVVGTAVGEEIVHRGVVLATWLSTAVSARWILVANLATFALWHVAGAADKGPAGVAVDVGGPAVLGAALLWARLRYRSVFASAAFHGAGNLGGSAVVGR